MIYFCQHCDQQKDSDYEVAETDPENKDSLVCPDCLEGIRLTEMYQFYRLYMDKFQAQQAADKYINLQNSYYHQSE